MPHLTTDQKGAILQTEQSTEVKDGDLDNKRTEFALDCLHIRGRKSVRPPT